PTVAAPRPYLSPSALSSRPSLAYRPRLDVWIRPDFVRRHRFVTLTAIHNITGLLKFLHDVARKQRKGCTMSSSDRLNLPGVTGGPYISFLIAVALLSLCSARLDASCTACPGTPLSVGMCSTTDIVHTGSGCGGFNNC